MLILGLESTCDETAAAIVKDGREILSNVVYSQSDLHNKYGGVVPEIASRRHIEVIIPVIQKALEEASISLEELDLIAVSQGPGLIGTLLIGVTAAKALAFALSKPLLGINHVEAHLYAAMMENLSEISFPILGLVISGGHTALLQIDAIGSYKLISQTVDDAIGEAFDKTAKLLNLPYPGGPEIEKLAHLGNPSKYKLTPGTVKGRPLAFSFSGIKTQVLYAIKGQNALPTDPVNITEEQKKDLSASFQQTVFLDVIQKTQKAVSLINAKAVIVGGGVSCNQTLRSMFQERHLPCPIYWPPKKLSVDNAAMIAGLAFFQYQRKGASDSNLQPFPNISFT